MCFWLALAVLGLAHFAMPRITRYLLITPFLGAGLGGFTWGVVSLFDDNFVSPKMFATFLITGIVIVGAAMLSEENME